ncbi:MAG: hypothetical protein VYC34_10115 [Planctomycetota bacterium]|nr:hypothetical protein [Planctomycetota bacterium]
MRPLIALALLLPLTLLSTGCATLWAPTSADRLESAAQPEGVYVRHIRLRVAPADVADFESLMHDLAVAATRANLAPEHAWLCYAEPPCRYWLISFGETPGGAVAEQSFESFARRIAAESGAMPRGDLNQRLAAIDVREDWSHLHRQTLRWSTVEQMTTATHPKARMVLYRIDKDRIADFDRAMVERTAFLIENEYPLPIEAFLRLNTARAEAIRVVFPVDWPSFYERDSMDAFQGRLDDAQAARLEELDQQLIETVTWMEYFDADFIPRLNFGAE